MKINFAKYLLEILLEKGKVDVPGLGNFQLERKSASFGEGRKSLKAPTKEIIFSEEHQTNDTVLQDRIAQKEDESVDTAKAGEFVNQFTSDVLKGLMEHKEVEIAYLGTIKRGADEKISFVQNQATIDKLNKYLPEVELPEQKKVEPEVKATINEKVAATEQKASIEEAKPKVAEVKKEASSAIRKDIEIPEPTPPAEPKSSWLKWLLAIIALIVISTLTFKMCGKEDQSAYKTTQVEDDGSQTEDQVPDVNDEETEASSDGMKEGAEDIDFKEDEEDTNEEPVKTAADFNKEQCPIIIGSYQNNKNLRSTISKIESKGYTVYEEKHGAYTRVGMSVACDEVDGNYTAYLRNISKEFGVNAWWLYPPK